MLIAAQIVEAGGPDQHRECLFIAGQSFYAARRRYLEYQGDDAAEEERLCSLCSKARLKFEKACERFFVSEAAQSHTA